MTGKEADVLSVCSEGSAIFIFIFFCVEVPVFPELQREQVIFFRRFGGWRLCPFLAYRLLQTKFLRPLIGVFNYEQLLFPFPFAFRQAF